MSAIDDSHNLNYVVSLSPVTALGATAQKPAPLCTLGLAGLSITVRPSVGNTTLNGQFKLQCTDFGADRKNVPLDTDWVDYPSSTQPVAAATITAPLNWEVSNPASAWFRVVFINGASASPLVDVAVTHRTIP
jgi:hypothetical protein